EQGAERSGGRCPARRREGPGTGQGEAGSGPVSFLEIPGKGSPRFVVKTTRRSRGGFIAVRCGQGRNGLPGARHVTAASGELAQVVRSERARLQDRLGLRFSVVRLGRRRETLGGEPPSL